MNILCTICFAVLFIGIRSFASEPNIIESTRSCPEDSMLIDGICKCNHEICKKPDCDTILHLETNYTNLPGFCCPSFKCLECLQDTVINETDGKCSCAPDAFFNEFGKCECQDPHKTLQDNVCVCDFNKCELPHLCDEMSVPVKVNDGCCSNVKCLPCPADSYSKSYHSDDIEDMCVCFPCPEPECNNETQTPVIIRKGKNIPGMCCDLYKCENKNTTEKICKVNDTSYTEGGTWVTPEKDNCTCQNGISLCGKNLKLSANSSCLFGDVVYPHLHSWIEDTCTNCTCYNGNYKCVAHMCEVNVSEIKPTECPTMIGCKKICELGYKIKKGCEICKCRGLSKIINAKYPLLETFMEKLNISENETVLLLRQQLEAINNDNGGVSVEITTTSTAVTSPPSTSVYIYGTTIDTENVFTTILTPIITFIFGILFCCVVACAIHFFKNGSYKYAPVKKPMKTSNTITTDSYCQKNFELQPRSDIKYVNEKIPLT